VVDGDDPNRGQRPHRGRRGLFVTHKVLIALNSAPRYRLALVRIDPRSPDHVEVRSWSRFMSRGI
jgi:hypothetical protein